MTRPDGRLIRDLRRKRGMTTHQLAGRAGFAERTLRKLEHEQTENPHPETIAALAGALGVKPEELLEPPVRPAASEADSAGYRVAASLEGLHPPTSSRRERVFVGRSSIMVRLRSALDEALFTLAGAPGLRPARQFSPSSRTSCLRSANFWIFVADIGHSVTKRT